MAEEKFPRVVIVGAGFGGLEAAKKLACENVQLTVVDRTNYHLFQPLLYQVATAALSPADIAAPVRAILHKYKNVEVILAEVSVWFSPSAVDIMCYLRDMNFEWYDVAALNGRTRDNRLCQGDFVFVRADSNLAADRSWE